MSGLYVEETCLLNVPVDRALSIFLFFQCRELLDEIFVIRLFISLEVFTIFRVLVMQWVGFRFKAGLSLCLVGLCFVM